MNASEATVFQYKPLLLSIAYEILGNVKDAEDAVQDTFLKWFEHDTSHVDKIKPYLISTLKNICFNWSKRAGKLREIKEELMELKYRDYFSTPQWMDFDKEVDLSKAYSELTKKLNISEKTVYLLREVFNFDYADISEIVDHKAENCRKILERAKKRLEEKNERFRYEADKAKETFVQFQNACSTGKLNELVLSLKRELLQEKKD